MVIVKGSHAESMRAEPGLTPSEGCPASRNIWLDPAESTFRHVPDHINRVARSRKRDGHPPRQEKGLTRRRDRCTQAAGSQCISSAGGGYLNAAPAGTPAIVSVRLSSSLRPGRFSSLLPIASASIFAEPSGTQSVR